jgi:hypothetical protein
MVDEFLVSILINSTNFSHFIDHKPLAIDHSLKQLIRLVLRHQRIDEFVQAITLEHVL